jgi:5-methylcytosine-specific restriction endonuclease McrA
MWSRKGEKMKSKRSKATDIPMSVKKKVWERDKHRCVLCGNYCNVMPNAHFIPRSKGGLGIEENIITLCTELTPNKCHRRYDFGTKKEREQIREQLKNYLKSKYENWNEEDLIYKRTY